VPYGIDQLRVPTTKSEREDKKYDMNDVMRAARLRMEGNGICINAISRRRLNKNSRFTMIELNQIVDEVVDDSNFYNQ